MQSLLILNTALGRAGAVVWRDGHTVAKYAREERQSAQTILELAAAARRESALVRADAVAVVAGPGSFTGTRIGIAAAQGLCAAWDVPALPLSSLALTATAAERRRPSGGYLVALEARAEELYFGAYLPTDQGLRLCGAEQVGPLERLRFAPPPGAPLSENWLAVGDGWPDEGAVERRFGIRPASAPFTVAVEEVDLVLLARTGWERGELTSADLLRPNYVNDTPRYREAAGGG